MTEVLSIYNLALRNLETHIRLENLSDKSQLLDKCNQYYPVALNELLSKHEWSFARDKNPKPEDFSPAFTVALSYCLAFHIRNNTSIKDICKKNVKDLRRKAGRKLRVAINTDERYVKLQESRKTGTVPDYTHLEQEFRSLLDHVHLRIPQDDIVKAMSDAGT